MSIGIGEFLSTGTIHVHVGTGKEVKYSVYFSPDADHRVTHELKHKYAVFLKKKPSSAKGEHPEAQSIAKPLIEGFVILSVNNQELVEALSRCAIEQAKVDVFVKSNGKKLDLVGIRIPAIQSSDQDT